MALAVPKKVKILNHIWTIKEVEFPVDEVTGFEPYGECERMDQTIKINKGMSVDNKRSTLIHELLHACRYSNGNAGLIPDFSEIPKHEVILTWEHFLLSHYEESVLSLLRDNPKLIAYLTEK